MEGDFLLTNSGTVEQTGAKALRLHRFGVNYTPTKNWLFFWNDFDADSVARDLDAIASLGLDHFRIVAMWPYFQPNPTWVSPTHLNRLDHLMRLAEQRNLDVCVCMLNGWISGYPMRPVYDESGQSFYASQVLFEAVKLYFTEVAKVVRGRTNFLGFDIGNEMNCCWSAGSDTGTSDAWLDRILTVIEALCPEQTHVMGVDHQPWFHPETFSARQLARRPRLVALHSWILFTGALKHGGPLDPPCVKLAAGMANLARVYAGDPAKPIWLQEYGASPEWMDEMMIPRFMEAATLAAIEEGICWFTWWASHDVDRRFQFSSLEYELGLITLDNRIKNSGWMFKSIAEQYRGKPVVIKPGKALLTPPEQKAPEATWKWLLEWMR